MSIKDVAARAGVSAAAVSKVLNHRYGVSEQTRARVEKAVRELGYRPNAAARTLRSRSRTIGVVADITSGIVAEIVAGVTEGLADSGLDLLLAPVGLPASETERSVETMVDRDVEGIVLIAPTLALETLEDLGRSLPLVLIGRHGGGQHFDSVTDDDEAGAHLAVDHLVELGHRRIVHLTTPAGELVRPSVLPQTARLDGYERAMRGHGLSPDVVVVDPDTDDGYEAATTALTGSEPTAVFAGTDLTALAVIRAATDHDLRIPDDISVAGADNIPLGAHPRLSLTTVDPSGRQNGVKAAEFLRERIEGRTTPANYAFTPRLVVRGSTGPVPGAVR